MASPTSSSKPADRKIDRAEAKRLAAIGRLGDRRVTPANSQYTGCVNKAR